MDRIYRIRDDVYKNIYFVFFADGLRLFVLVFAHFQVVFKNNWLETRISMIERYDLLIQFAKIVSILVP